MSVILRPLIFSMQRKQEVLQDVVIKFAGDSGDGMQLTGTQFTNNTALLGTDLSTFPDFPARDARAARHTARRKRLPVAVFFRKYSYAGRCVGCSGGYECQPRLKPT